MRIIEKNLGDVIVLGRLEIKFVKGPIEHGLLRAGEGGSLERQRLCLRLHFYMQIGTPRL